MLLYLTFSISSFFDNTLVSRTSTMQMYPVLTYSFFCYLLKNKFQLLLDHETASDLILARFGPQ